MTRLQLHLYSCSILVNIWSTKNLSSVDLPTSHQISMANTESNLPALPLTIPIPTQHQRLLREVRTARNKVLSFDPVLRKLVTWYWSVPKFEDRTDDSYVMDRPTDDNRCCMTPSDLHDYRNSHKLDNPYCFCCLFVMSVRVTRNEVTILIETAGPYAGEYVVKCMKNECGYFGESMPPTFQQEHSGSTSLFATVPLERLYDQVGLRGKVYPLRGKSQNSFPASVLSLTPSKHPGKRVLHWCCTCQKSSERISCKRQVHTTWTPVMRADFIVDNEKPNSMPSEGSS